jgi:hypothetical protein
MTVTATMQWRHPQPRSGEGGRSDGEERRI